MNMLDDLDYIARFDSQNALAIAAGEHQQLNYQYKFELPKIDKIASVVLAGMGGSAQSALLLRSWLDDELKVPFVITRDFDIPAFVNEQTLFIACSYSGNTEETINALKMAETKQAPIVILTAGGELAEIAKQKNYPLLLMPAGYEPRMTTMFGLKLLCDLFQAIGLVQDKSAELKATAEFLEKTSLNYLPQVATKENPAKQIAEQLLGKSIVIYGSPLLATTAYKWKIYFNENAKNLAFCNSLPEFGHNEFIGWTAQPKEKLFGVVELASTFDTDHIKKRFDISNRLLSGNMPKPIEVRATGDTKLAQILWTVQLGEFASIYLAILNNVNPTPVDLVEKLKKELA